MRNILRTLFPFELQMNILQLEGYNANRYISWIAKHLFARVLARKKPLKLTTKVIVLIILSFLWLLFFGWLAYAKTNWLIATITVLLLLTQPYMLYLLSVAVLSIYEALYRRNVVGQIRHKILTLKNLKVIAITGSFGKSSTKEILYQMLKRHFTSLRTPASYNTVFGIAKVVDLELEAKYQYFICEMAAYKKGEIAELCSIVPPTFGILTGITTQHLERFGSLKNIISTKFELIDAIKKPGFLIFNLDDRNISKELKKRGIENLFGYGITNPDADVSANNISFDESGSSFFLSMAGRKQKVYTSLFGYSNIYNILAAAAMAFKLGVKRTTIAEEIRNLRPFNNRNVVIKSGNTFLVDNTYSSNVEGFRQTISTAKLLSGAKVLVTPGIVELGREKEKDLHQELGEESKDAFAKIVLVGKNARTISLAKGFENKTGIEFIKDDRTDYLKTLGRLKKEYKWIFLESDLPQNY